MEIFKLSNEELSNIAKDTTKFREHVVLSNGLILTLMKEKKIAYDVNKLFDENSINLDVLEYSWSFINKNFEEVNLNIEHVKSIVLMLSVTDIINDTSEISIFNEKCVDVLKNNNINVDSLGNINDLQVTSGVGENTKNFTLNKNVKSNNPFFKFSDVNKEEQITDVIEKPYVYRREVDYYGDNEDEESEEVITEDTLTKEVIESFEKKYREIRKSILIKPFTPKLNEPINNLLSTLFSKNLNKDDLLLEKYEVEIKSKVQKDLLTVLKDETKDPKEVITELIMYFPELRGGDKQSLYLLFDNKEAMALLRQTEFIKNVSEKLANQQMYIDLKEKEVSLFNIIDDEVVEILDYENRNDFVDHLISVIKERDDESKILLKDIENLKSKTPVKYNEMDQDELLSELIYIAQELVNYANNAFIKIQSSDEFVNWKQDFKKYVESYVYVMLMITVDLGSLNTEDLNFVKNLLKENIEIEQSILEKNINSPVLIGMNSLNYSNIFYSTQKNVFNNDKILALKDYFVEKIKNPMYMYHGNRFFDGISKLNAFEIEGDSFDRYYPAFKYLTMKEAMEIGYNMRFYTPTESVNYILEEENAKALAYTPEMWSEIIESALKNTNPVVFNDNRLSNKLEKVISLGKNNAENIFSKEIAVALLKELFTVEKYELISRSGIHSLSEAKFNQYNSVQNIEFYNSNDIWTDKKEFIKHKNKVSKAVNAQLKDLDNIISLLDNYDSPSLTIKNELFQKNSRITHVYTRGNFKYYLKAWVFLCDDAQKNNNLEQLSLLRELIPLVDYSVSRESYDYDRKKPIDDRYTKLDYIIKKNILLRDEVIINNVKYDSGVKEEFEHLDVIDLMKNIRKKSMNVLTDQEKILYQYYDLLKEDYLNSFKDKSGEFNTNKVLKKILEEKFYDFGESNYLLKTLSIEELYRPLSSLFKDFDNEFIYLLLNASSAMVNITTNYNGNKHIVSLFKENNQEEYLSTSIMIEKRDGNNVVKEESTLSHVALEYIGLETTSFKKDVELMKELLEHFKGIHQNNKDEVDFDFVNMFKTFYEENKNISIETKMKMNYEREKLSDESIDIRANVDFYKLLNVSKEEKINLYRNSEEQISNLYYLMNEQKNGKIENIDKYIPSDAQEFFIETMEKAERFIGETYSRLKKLGWDNESLYKLKLSTLRGGLFKDFSEEDEILLKKISNEVFNEIYKKEDFERNYLLAVPMNSYVFKYFYHKNKSTILPKILDISIENLALFEELGGVKGSRFNNNADRVMKLTAKENLLLILKNERHSSGEYLSFDQLASLNKQEVFKDMLQEDYANLSMLTGISTVIEIGNFLGLNKNKIDWKNKFEKESENASLILGKIIEKDTKTLLSLISEDARKDILELINSQQYLIKNIETSEQEVQPPIQTIDEYIEIVKNVDENKDDMLLNVSRDFSTKLKDILINEYKKISMNEIIELLNTEEVRKINKTVIDGTFDAKNNGHYNHSREDFNQYKKSFIYPVELKKIWFDEFEKVDFENIIKRGSKTELLNFIKVFSLNEENDCLKGDDLIEKYLNIYNEYKNKDDATYYFAHIAFSQEIVINMGEQYFNLMKKKYGKQFEDIFSYAYEKNDFVLGAGSILFYEHMDINKLKNVIDTIDKSEIPKESYVAFAYYVLGSYTRRSYRFLGEKEIGDLMTSLKNSPCEMSEEILGLLNKKADDAIIKMKDSGVFDIFFYENIFGRNIENSEVFNNLVLEDGNKDLTDILFNEKVLKIVDEKYFDSKAYDALLINKIGSNAINQIVLTLKVLEYAESNSRYQSYSILRDVARAYNIEDKDRDKKNIQKIVDRFRLVSENQYFEEMKGFERVKELHLLMDDSAKKPVKSKKKI